MRFRAIGLHRSAWHLVLINAKNTRGRAENGTRWTRAAAPHNTTVVSTQNDFNMDQMTLDLCFANVISKCFY